MNKRRTNATDGGKYATERENAAGIRCRDKGQRKNAHIGADK